MSTAQLFFILATVGALAAGQILFKQAASVISWTAGTFIGSILSAKLMVALALYSLATLMWLYALKTTPLRIAYPFTALAFVIVPILGHFLLGERVGWNTFAGALLIASGVWLSVYK
ncbi:MAG: EamA family transporter [Candidimonas sp.]|nr:EamA family transporter [Candidimonas sp.]